MELLLPPAKRSGYHIELYMVTTGANGMRRLILVVNLVTSSGAAWLLWKSIWPGWPGYSNIFVDGFLVPLVRTGTAILGLGWLIAIIALLVRRQRLGFRAFFAPLAVAATIGMLAYDVPLRIAFAGSRGGFEQRLRLAPSTTNPVAQGQTIGIYNVDKCAADARGGVYFRTGTTKVGFLDYDTVSSGFVYRPNTEGTPFGADSYRLGRLSGDWYWFRASAD